MQNPNCDGGKCYFSVGEVRVLPLAGDGNLILCQTCFDHEIQFRKQRNKSLSKDAMFDLPLWNNMQAYDTTK